MDKGSYIEGEEYPGIIYDYRDYPKNPRPRTGFLQLSQSIEEENVDRFGDEIISISDCGTSKCDKNIIDVCLRIKPSKSKSNPCNENVLEVADNQTVIFKPTKELKSAYSDTFKYKFSNIYGPHITQSEIFKHVVQNMLEKYLRGEDALLFTFGTTNSGKTYTIQGTLDQPGIIPRTINIVFKSLGSSLDPNSELMFKPAYAINALALPKHDMNLQQDIRRQILNYAHESTYYTAMSSQCSSSQYSQAFSNQSRQREEQELSSMFQSLPQEFPPLDLSCLDGNHVSIWICFYEVYNENIYDLLDVHTNISKKRNILKIGRDQKQNVYIKELTYVNVFTSEEAYKVLKYGKNNLSFASTSLNNRSSRSHCVFSLKLLVADSQTGDLLRMSSFDICDLAGTERQKKALTSGERLKEARTINSSLHVLTRCFNILRENSNLPKDKKKLVPYRDSKLTQIFQRSLNGDRSDVTVKMIVNVNTSPYYADETLQVLKISAVARDILTVVKPKKTINVDRKKSRFSTIASQYENRNVNWQDSDILTGRGSRDYFSEEEEDLYEKINYLESRLAEFDGFDKDKFENDIREECVNEFQEMHDSLMADWRNEVNSLREEHEEEVKELKKFYIKQIEQLNEMLKSNCSDEESFNETIREDAGVSSLHKEENARLKHKISELHDENKNLKKINAEMNKANEQLKKRIENLEARPNPSETTTNKDMKYMRELLDEAKEDYKVQQEEIHELRVEVEELLVQKKEFEVKCVELEEEVEQRDAIITAKTDEIEDLQEKLDFLENKLQEESVEYERIISCKENEIIELRRANMEQRLKLENSTQSTPSSDLSMVGEQALQKEIKNMATLLVSRDTEIKDLKTKILKYGKWYNANRTEKADKEKLIDTLKQKCEGLERQVSKLDADSKSFLNTIQNMEQDEQSLKANHEQVLAIYEERLKKCQDELAKHRVDQMKKDSEEPVTNKDLEERVKILKKELSEQQAIVRNVQLKLLQKDESLNKFKSMVDTARTPFKSLHNEMANMSLENDDDDDPDFIPKNRAHVKAKSTSKKGRTLPPEVPLIESAFCTPGQRRIRTKLFELSPEEPATLKTPTLKDVHVESHIPSPKSQLKKKLRARKKNAEN